MEIRLEGKTLAIGILVGVIITISLGVDGVRDRATGRLVDTSAISDNSYRTDYSMAVGPDGMAFVRVQNGDFFVVNPKSGMAVRVLRARRLSDNPTDKRESRGKQFNFFAEAPPEEETGGY